MSGIVQSFKDIWSAYDNYQTPEWVEYLKFAWNIPFVTGCLIMIFTGVSLQYCVLQAPVPALFILLLLALTLLAYVEGLHYGVVSIEKWDMAQYGDKFPRAYKVQQLAPNAGTKIPTFYNLIRKYLIYEHIWQPSSSAFLWVDSFLPSSSCF